MTNARVEMIKSKLSTSLQALSVDIIDESHKHAGHAGARDGRGHFKVHIVAECFSGKTLLQRHRLVYDALQDAMQTDIHALSITAKSPNEV